MSFHAPLTVRPATKSDLGAMVLLLTELFSAEVELVPDPAKQRAGLEMILDHAAAGIIFVAERAGAVIGMVNLLFTVSTAEGGPALLLEDMIVTASHRGGGAGRALIENAQDYARTHGFCRITLLTDGTNVAAQGFYRRLGFEMSSMVPLRWKP